MIKKPFPQSFWVHEDLLCAGCYPGDLTHQGRDAKLTGLLDCNIRRIINLMEPGETGRSGAHFDPYVPRLRELALERGIDIECVNFPLPDARAPPLSKLESVLEALESGLQARIPTYLHCWGGHGRTGSVVCFHLMRRGHTADEAIAKLTDLRRDLPKNHYPFEGDQESFIRSGEVGPH